MKVVHAVRRANSTFLRNFMVKNAHPRCLCGWIIVKRIWLCHVMTCNTGREKEFQSLYFNLCNVLFPIFHMKYVHQLHDSMIPIRHDARNDDAMPIHLRFHNLLPWTSQRCGAGAGHRRHHHHVQRSVECAVRNSFFLVFHVLVGIPILSNKWVRASPRLVFFLLSCHLLTWE